MTKRQLKIGAIIAGGGFAIWWLFRSNNASAATGKTPPLTGPTGDVLLGVPTVSGPGATSGGTDYLTPTNALGMILPPPPRDPMIIA